MRPSISAHRGSGIRLIFILFVAASASGCTTTWTRAGAPLAQLVEEDPPSTIRVVLENGTEVEVRNPVVVVDSLYARKPDERPLAIAAVDDVRSVEVPKTSATQSLGAVIGISVAVVVGVSVLAMASAS